MMLAYSQAHQAPIFTDTYQSPFFEVGTFDNNYQCGTYSAMSGTANYPCGITSPLSPVSPVTPTLSGLSAPKTPTFPRQSTPTFHFPRPETPHNLVFPRPETPKMQLPTCYDLLRPKTPTLDLSRPKTPTLQQYSRPLTPSTKAFQSIFPPQSRTTELHTRELSCSEYMAEEEDTAYETSYTQSSMPVLYYISKMEELDGDAVIHQKGYQIIDKIRDCTQGAIWKAKVTKEGGSIPGNLPKGSIVAIKRVNKVFHQDRESGAKDFGMTELLEEDVVKEAAIMKHCTVSIRDSGRFILKFIDFFETSSEYCLVTEWHENALSMKEVYI